MYSPLNIKDQKHQIADKCMCGGGGVVVGLFPPPQIKLFPCDTSHDNLKSEEQCCATEWV